MVKKGVLIIRDGKWRRMMYNKIKLLDVVNFSVMLVLFKEKMWCFIDFLIIWVFKFEYVIVLLDMIVVM